MNEIIEDHAEWNNDITFDLYACDESMCNYILATYPRMEPVYLNTYCFNVKEVLDEKLIGESNVAYTESQTWEDACLDAITIIYADEKPVAMLDAYQYVERMNETIKSLQKTIIGIAIVSVLVVLVILVLITRYITNNLKHTSIAIEKISNGDLSARVEKIAGDELGVVGKGINEMAAQLKALFEEQSEFSMQAIECLVGTIDAKDKYTNGHSIRVAQYSALIARKLGKSTEEQRQIYYSGLLHDIGKIGIPDAIINKTSRLTDEEFGTIKTHPEIGYDILCKLSKLNNISVGAYSHHERIDGKGYPQGLKGEEIPELARIIGVADTYDAMTSNRSYRHKLPQEKVRSELENAKGTQLDAKFAQIMLDLDLEMYPDGYPDMTDSCK